MIEMEGYSRGFIRIINNIIDEVFSHFMEVGSNLEYEEIYGDVFPEHKRDDQISGMQDLKILHGYIRDDFHHNLNPLYEYILYSAMNFVYESSDDGFNLDNIITKQLTLGTVQTDDKDTLKLLSSIQTPSDLAGIIFEDTDFLEVGKFFDIYRKQPEIVTDFFNVDLDYYEELMPEDIKAEYNFIRNNITILQNDKREEMGRMRFDEVIIAMVRNFKHIIEHNKGYKLLNDREIQRGEKDVQILFNIIANLCLKNTDILVNQETDTGRGAVDFYLSIGKEHRALIELKLGRHQRYADGIDYQLPTYLMTEDIDLGIFVLICYSEHEFSNSKKLFGNAKELSLEYEKDIKFERIDASGTLKTASMIRNKIEMGFEE